MTLPEKRAADSAQSSMVLAFSQDGHCPGYTEKVPYVDLPFCHMEHYKDVSTGVEI